MTGAFAIARSSEAPASPAPSPKLVKAAQDFEAILLSTWLEKLEESYAGTDDDMDPAHGTLASMGSEAMASALAARGGIGIAQMLLQHLGKTDTDSGSSLTTAGSAAAGLQAAGQAKATLKFP
jgi:peptidoglycan hydrolase FlgJ